LYTQLLQVLLDFASASDFAIIDRLKKLRAMDDQDSQLYFRLQLRFRPEMERCIENLYVMT
jgi:hypothetical protein